MSDKSVDSMGTSTMEDIELQKEQTGKVSPEALGKTAAVKAYGRDEKDGVRSFFGFLKAFRASG
jgi:hypothetical protein